LIELYISIFDLDVFSEQTLQVVLLLELDTDN